MVFVEHLQLGAGGWIVDVFLSQWLKMGYLELLQSHSFSSCLIGAEHTKLRLVPALS